MKHFFAYYRTGYCAILLVIALFLLACKGENSEDPFFSLPPRDTPLGTSAGRNNNLDNLLSLPLTKTFGAATTIPVVNPFTRPTDLKGLTINQAYQIDRTSVILAVTNPTAAPVCGIRFLYDRNDGSGGKRIAILVGEHGFNTSYVSSCLLPNQRGFASLTFSAPIDTKGIGADDMSIIGIDAEKQYDLGPGIKVSAISRVSGNANASTLTLSFTLKNNSQYPLYICGALAPFANNGLQLIGFSGGSVTSSPVFMRDIPLNSVEEQRFAPGQEKVLTKSLFIVRSVDTTHASVNVNYGPYPCFSNEDEDD